MFVSDVSDFFILAKKLLFICRGGSTKLLYIVVVEFRVVELY